jgi:putative restriction endonuclease
MKVLRQAFGRFDEDLWKLIADPYARHQLREAIIARYFAGCRTQIASLPGICRESDLIVESSVLQEDFEEQRDAAFRKTVLELYDNTCAACGLRVSLNDGFSLVEGAHLIPWEESKNDNPNNGLALCPNHHRAMDNHLIGPCPHPTHRAGIWRIGRRLDERKDSRKDLVSLDQKPVLEPRDEMFLPALKGLIWREQKLQTPRPQ